MINKNGNFNSPKNEKENKTSGAFLTWTMMHHPHREDGDKRVVKEMVRGESEEVKARFDMQVITDRESRGVWWTFSNCLLAGLEKEKDGAQYIMIVHDDIVTCRHVVPSIENALRSLVRHKGVQPAAFYCPTGGITFTMERGHSWMTADGGTWCQGFAMPMFMVREFLSWAWTYTDPAWKGEDTRLGIWLMKQERPVYISAPSLIQHVGIDSIVGHPMKWGHNVRASKTFLGRERDGLQIDWEDGLRWGDDLTHEKRKLEYFTDRYMSRLRDGWEEAAMIPCVIEGASAKPGEGIKA